MSGTRAIGVETLHMTKRFGDFTALDDVSIRITPGSFHALLGENGAGKSTLVKCMMGFYQPSSGQMLVDGREAEIRNPRDAHAAGLGMVYQHFTLVPSLTAAENLVIAREDAPAVIDWKKEREGLQAFLETMPFRVALDQPVNRLSAGEKQKLELLKQLYLGRHFLILDEPTSVLTPSEADELLGMVRDLTSAGALTCLMITHKFREVTSFADAVSVLRRGAHVGGGRVSELTHDAMAAMMIGDKTLTPASSSRCSARRRSSRQRRRWATSIRRQSRCGAFPLSSRITSTWPASPRRPPVRPSPTLRTPTPSSSRASGRPARS
tara:strand:+ start:3454 stop:4422 length:969 start_codon:yes stop_codon:yes gene_type:complete